MDYLITGASVFDGIQTEPQKLAIGIEGERIVYVGKELSSSAAKRVIEAKGLYLCPGFIDTHASTGLGYRFPNAGDNKLSQGVTTEIIGNCGTSSGPVGDLLVSGMEQQASEIGFTFDWRSLGEWFQKVEEYGLPFNFGTYVGHSTLRAGVCEDTQQVTENEIQQMSQLLEQSMQEGALGLATGLVYAPGSFATTQEIIELAKVSKKYNGIYVSHIRDERQNLEKSIEEAIEIGRQAKLPILVSHLKAAEKPNWGKIPKVIQKIEKAREEGIQVCFEVYPYTAVSTKLRTFIPKDTLSEGVLGMVAKLKSDFHRAKSIQWLTERETDYTKMILITESVPNAQGKSIQEVAQQYQKEPAAMIVELLIKDPEAWVVYHCISQEDLDAGILWDNSIICSDSWSYPVNAPHQIGNPHPRTFGAFTRFLEQYVIGKKRLSFGEAIRKITSFPAKWLNLPERGCIKEGYYADLVLLSPENIKEKATFKDPRQFSEGTEFVWVNGTLMLEHQEFFDLKPGKILKNTYGR